jgi:hypothetical protein
MDRLARAVPFEALLGGERQIESAIGDFAWYWLRPLIWRASELCAQHFLQRHLHQLEQLHVDH